MKTVPLINELMGLRYKDTLDLFKISCQEHEQTY